MRTCVRCHVVTQMQNNLHTKSLVEKTQTHLNEKAHIHRSEQMLFHKFTPVYIHLLTQSLTHLFMICKHFERTTHGTTEKYF